MSNPVGSSLSLTNIADDAQIVAADHRNNYSAIQTEVNDLVACLSGGVAGQLLQAVSSSAVDWNGGTYQAYTPTWTASGTAPAFGNATINARYTQVGKLVHYYARILPGSTSTFGTGIYSFSLPVAGNANNTNLGSGYIFHAGTSGFGWVVPIATSTTTFQLQYGATYLGASTPIGQLAPWTWATGDHFSWNITYEAA